MICAALREVVKPYPDSPFIHDDDRTPCQHKVVKAVYEQVIANGISGAENLPTSEAIEYLVQKWLPFAQSVLEASYVAD